MFRLSRNERSHWSRNGVHVEPELVFMIGRNMHESTAGRKVVRNDRGSDVRGSDPGPAYPSCGTGGVNR